MADVSMQAAKAAAANAAAGCKDGTKKTFFQDMAASFGGAIKGADKASKGVNAWMITQTKVLRSQSNSISEGINDSANSIAGGIAGLSTKLEGTVDGWKREMNQALKPVSTAIGSTVGTLETVVKNPLGAPQMLANGAIAVLDKISPGFANEVQGAFKGVEMENLANLPGQMMGSIRSLTMAADSLLSVPFTILSDIYNGLMDIMEELANLIDSAVSMIFDFFFGPGGLLDSILPISEIMSLLESIGELASMVGGLASMAGGFPVVTNITSQITGAVSNISSIVKNPMQMAGSLVPGFDKITGGISQITGGLRNPEQFIQKALPASITGQLQKLSSMPGLGFVGNFGNSIGDSLETLKGGVLTKAFDSFANQLPIVAPLLNQQTPGAQQTAVNTQESHPPEYDPSKIVAQADVSQAGVRQLQDTTAWKVMESLA